MAVSLLRVLVLGVIAAAADDVPVKWVGPWSVSLPCAVPEGERAAPRRPPPPLDDERARPRPYLWRVGNHTLNRSDDRVSANGSLEVSRRRDGREGVYQCAVRTAGGVVLGYPVHLKFAYINSRFSAAPENTTVAAGQPAVLRCDVGSGPRARVLWLRDARALPHDDRYIILENQLLILDVQKEDEGYYRCNATNPVLNKTRTSPAARLAVTGAAEAAGVGFLPLQHAAQLAVPRGSRVVLPCPVTGWPRPKIVWEVTPAGGRRSELESVAQTLALDAVQPADEGRYSCAVEGRSDLVKSFVVSVTEAPVLTLPPAPKQSLPASTVRFNCTAAGRPPPRLSWYKDGKPLVLTGRIQLLPSVDGKRMELLIRSVTSDDAGVYQCFAAGEGAGWASAWARLGVSGAEAAAPRGVRCQPAAAARVRVRWERAADAVLAYTVQINKPGGTSLPGQPITSSEEIINVGEPLTPYGFQVRAYIHSVSNKTIASDLSKLVICQGQGVPLKLLQLAGGAVLVSWRQFALEWPGVLQWLLQARPDNSSQEHNVTLDAAVTNYTVALPGAGPVQVRVLGTRALPWLQQDLTLVPWTSSAAATHQLDSGGVTSAPSDVEVTAVGAREFTVRWRHDEADLSPETFSYTVCVRKVDGNEECIESASRSTRVPGLAPASEYSVRVRARPPPAPPAPPAPAPAPLQPPARRASDFTAPVYITTQPEGVERFKDLTYKLVNASCLRVSWHSQPDKYIVHYSDELKLPINQWAFVETNGNTVLLNGLDLTRELYVMVTGYEPVGHSPIFTIPVQIRESEIHYSVGAGGVRVWWAGRGARVLHYSQNITRPLDAWATRTVDTNHVTITGLDLSKPTYVMVAPPGVSQRNQVITIEPQPPESYSVYLVVGVVCALAGAGALAGGAACAARGRKRRRERREHRSRRRNPSRGEGDDEEGSEMKALGTRLANGTRAPRAARAPRAPRAPPDPRDAGEPLLNGHVHITENPTSKTSNGKLRKGHLYEAPFDVSRRSAELSPEETPVPPAPPACLVLDTSRAPAEVTALSALADKLPDDNMNSQVRRGSAPTLQPNG